MALLLGNHGASLVAAHLPPSPWIALARSRGGLSHVASRPAACKQGFVTYDTRMLATTHLERLEQSLLVP